MNIGFEAKRFFTNYTGLGNYSRFVIDALSSAYPQNNHYLFSPKIGDHVENRAILKRSNVKVVAPHGLYAKPGLSALWRTFAMSKNANIKHLHLFHGLSQELPFGLPSRIKKVVTVHDLIFLRYPKFYNTVDIAIYKSKVQAACESADVVIAISDQTAQDIRHFLKLSDVSKIRVVYQGCHPIFNKIISDAELLSVKKKYSLPAEFILNVGTVEERKNLLLLIRAIAAMPAGDRLPLVVVGRHAPYFEKVLEEVRLKKLQGSVIFLDSIEFQDLPAIYRQAKLFVYPSFFEGFGIPLIEAIKSSVPVITSTGSCFHEAAGTGASYVEPQDHEKLATEITAILSSEARRKQMVEAGQRHIQNFEPGVIAENLNTIYRQLVPQHSTVQE